MMSYSTLSLVSQSSDDDYSDMDISDVASDSFRDGRASPAPSAYSYTSSADGGAMLRDLHGRVFNSANETYMLPADVPEHGRLDLQHTLLLERVGGLYIQPDYVDQLLAPRDNGPPPRVIDIGTGSGSWVIDMAKKFPHAEITGLDLAPANLSSEPPPNCRFECDDANLGFAHYYNTFDVVHARCVWIGLDDTKAFFREVASMLRPGGIFLWADGDLQMYDENFQARTSGAEDEPSFAWLQKVTHAGYHCMKSRGAQVDMSHMADRWLQEIDGWEVVDSDSFFIQIGPWDRHNLDDQAARCAEYMRQDVLGLMQSIKPLLLSHGYFEEMVTRWIANVQLEVAQLRKKSHTKWHYGFAIKRQD